MEDRIEKASDGRMFINGTEVVIRRQERLHLIDSLRGVAIIMMVFFHLFYSMKYLFGLELAWFSPPFSTVWQFIIASMFVGIAGFSSNLSHSNVGRALRLFSVAILITVVTWVASVDTPIKFGVIHCLAVCIFIYALVEPALKKVDPRILAVVALYMYYMTYSVQDGFLTLAPSVHVMLPESLYSTQFLFWLGFPHERFASGDYFPLMPYFFMFLFGAALGMIGSREGYASVLYKGRSGVLGFLGNHSLAVYLIHQPIIIGILFLITM